MFYRSLWEALGSGQSQGHRPTLGRRAGRPRSRARRPALGLESLEDRRLLTTTPVSPVLGNIVGMGTVLNQQDAFKVNLQGSVERGEVHYSGTLSFVDKMAGETFNAATITSVQL